MQRSRTQILFSYLPGKVFVHEEGMVARSWAIRGEVLSGSINKPALLSEIDRYLLGWEEDGRINLPLPSQVEAQEFVTITPEMVLWEIWPLVFECSKENCRRIRTFRRIEEVSQEPRCRYCKGRMRQLRYFSAHDCGDLKPMYVPRCAEHGYDHIYFDDTGTFLTSVFRCRACAGGVVRRTAQSPCGCNAFAGPDGRSMMRAFTVRDTRTYYTHSIWLINFKSRTFQDLQGHPLRGQIAVASYLGLVSNLSRALREADRGSGRVERITEEEWVQKKAKLKEMSLTDAQIEEIRASIGPSTEGLGALGEVPELSAVGEELRVIERALLYDGGEVDRITLDDVQRGAAERSDASTVAAITAAQGRAADLGLEEVAVTWNFPIALAAFGYTRNVKGRGEGRLRGFARQGQYEGKTPIFAVATETEAVLVTVSAQRMLEWLARRGSYLGNVPDDQRAARAEILRLFAHRRENPIPASEATTLLHSMSHALLRSLDDGRTGFAEASLAEWIVPETLTFAIFANSLKSYTLGALWTLINSRTLQWLERAWEGVWHCENDPLCHQRKPRACERCLYVSFGCREFNDHLSRVLLQDFWREK